MAQNDLDGYTNSHNSRNILIEQLNSEWNQFSEVKIQSTFITRENLQIGSIKDFELVFVNDVLNSLGLPDVETIIKESYPEIKI